MRLCLFIGLMFLFFLLRYDLFVFKIDYSSIYYRFWYGFFIYLLFLWNIYRHCGLGWSYFLRSQFTTKKNGSGYCQWATNRTCICTVLLPTRYNTEKLQHEILAIFLWMKSCRALNRLTMVDFILVIVGGRGVCIF